MKPVFQEAPHDCVRACVASILEVPLSDVPVLRTAAADGVNEAPWSRNLRAWLATRGLAVLNVEVPNAGAWPDAALAFHHIRIDHPSTGTSHAVVYFAGQLVHDPLRGNRQPFQADRYPQTYLIIVKL